MRVPETWEELLAGRDDGLRGVFEEYETLVAGADLAFRKVATQYGDLVRCRPGCQDCCHAVFGLLPVESVYLAYRFGSVDGSAGHEAVLRARGFDRELTGLRARHGSQPDPLALARERLRCPLLGTGDRCLLYQYRPVTCRVYGIPTVIGGRSHVCGWSGFEKGGAFPAFNLDQANRVLYRLSGRLLAAVGHPNPVEASSVLSAVSRSLTRAPAELLRGGPD